MPHLDLLVVMVRPSSFSDPSEPWFPPVESADEYGLVMVGGRLTPEWLIAGYRRGIFPWPDSSYPRLVPWVSPDPRGIIEFDQLHISRRLRDTLRRGKFRVTLDADFPAVMRGCAAPRQGQRGTWITPPLYRGYVELHRLGVAHSLEVWLDDQLAGGIYGVAIGGYFSAESMFHQVTDASKVALVGLVDHLRQRGYTLLDIQQLTDHTRRMGGSEISRDEFLARMRIAQALPVNFGDNDIVT